MLNNIVTKVENRKYGNTSMLSLFNRGDIEKYDMAVKILWYDPLILEWSYLWIERNELKFKFVKLKGNK